MATSPQKSIILIGGISKKTNVLLRSVSTPIAGLFVGEAATKKLNNLSNKTLDIPEILSCCPAAMCFKSVVIKIFFYIGLVTEK